jgi:hypothetical protein
MCEKTFKYLDVKTKHVQIKHQNAKFYCHYFNNMKTCPYEDECVFLHEPSKLCKYGDECERTLCMFRHENTDNKVSVSELNKNADDGKVNHCDEVVIDNPNEATEEKNINEEENENETETVNEEQLSKIINVDENDELDDQENMVTNSTFINPSQFEHSSRGTFFKCDICDFVTARQTFIKDHKELTHNWCSLCFSSFKTQEKMKKHVQDLHSDN